jgi:signal transduction histidine kinase
MKTPAQGLRAISRFFSSSISNRIIIPYALLTLMLAAFGVFVVTQLVAGSFEERLKNQLIDAGRIVSDEVVNRERLRLEVERTVANTIGLPQALIDRDFQELYDLVFPHIANTNTIDSVVLLDTQGKEVLRLQRETVNSNAPLKTYQGSAADFFGWNAVARVLSDPQGSLKDVQIAKDTNSNELIIYTVGPVKGPEGTVGAVLVGTYLKREVDAIHELALTDVTLFDEQGDVVISTLVVDEAEATEIFKALTPQRFEQIVEQAEDVVFLDEVEGPDTVESQGDIEARGQTYRQAYAPFILRGQVYGVYAVALPTNFITNTNNQSRTLLSIIFSAGVVAVLVIGYVVSQRIIRPIIRLVQTSQDIAKGNLDRRTGLERDDEIGILASTFDDMTSELQKKTIELREEASKLTAILHSIADGVIVQDLEGNVITTNPAAEEILAAVGDDFMSPDSETSNIEVGQELGQIQSWPLFNHLTGLEFHETRRFEMGRRVLSALSAPVVTSDGEQLGSVVVLRDITREVEAERLKDDFITSMSHELRTPPTAIKGYNDLLKMTANNLDERQKSFIEAIEENVTDLLKIIQQMLDLSQIDAGTLGIDQELENLTELIETEAEQWTGKMEKKELAFSIHLPDEPIWVEGDWDRLTQVMNNLISNAYNYTLPGGRVEVLVKQKGDQAQVDIKDTGVGISKEDQRFLFTRFFRAIHDERTFDVSGAGLGLYMSKAIIESHNGSIWVESELHQGSTFSFALPVADAELVEAEEEMMEYLETR